MIHDVAINPSPHLTGDEESCSACTLCGALGGVGLVIPSVIQLNPRFSISETCPQGAATAPETFLMGENNTKVVYRRRVCSMERFD
jgi:NAD-dependent dihydropyrimidine dehydrogenase PreA subunit